MLIGHQVLQAVEEEVVHHRPVIVVESQNLDAAVLHQEVVLSAKHLLGKSAQKL